MTGVLIIRVVFALYTLTNQPIPFHFFRSTRRLRISVRFNALWLSIVTEENDGAE